MKLMDIDSDTLGIPDTEYDARVTMPSAEFTRIVRDLSLLGESVRIEVSKEGVRFASDGEAANGSVLLRQTEGTSIGKVKPNKKPKKDKDTEDAEDVEGDDEEGGEKAAKKEVKKEVDGDVDMDEDGDEEFIAKSDDEGEEEQDEDDDDDEENGKKRKKKGSSSKKPAKKAKTSSKGKGKKKATSDDDSDDDDFEGVRIEMNSHVSLTFSLKYLVNFSKSASLSSKVQLMMSNDVPLLVSEPFLCSPKLIHIVSFRYLTISARDISGTSLPPRSVMTRL